jgi:hypothetical protein
MDKFALLITPPGFRCGKIKGAGWDSPFFVSAPAAG